MASLTKKFVAVGIAILVAGLAFDAQAQDKQAKAKVRNVKGQVQYKANAGADWATLKTDATLNVGAVIETGKDSSVDLFIADLGSVIRITPSTQFALDKMSYTPDGQGGVLTDTEFNLKAGTILGNVKKLAVGSRYDVKVPNGVCGIRGTTFKVSANGVVSVVSGTVRVTYTIPGQAPVTVNVLEGQTFIPPTGGQAAQVVNYTPIQEEWTEFRNQAEGTTVTKITPEGVIEIKVPEATTKPTTEGDTSPSTP